VIVARKERGITPLRLTLDAGNTTVLLRKEGFVPWSRQVTLAAGREARLQATLTALPAPPPPTPAPPPVKPVVRTGDLVPLGPEVKPPRRISDAGAPSFTGKVPKLKEPASVLVEFVVTESGNVTNARIVESGGEALDRACLDAVAGRRYEPAELRGVRVKVVQVARFTFRPR
jgi:TonB family protein